MISAATKVFCIIGKPVRHSLSPRMHNPAFRELGIDAVYTAFEVDPDSVGDAVKGVRALGIGGASVTIPHKVSVIPFLDEISDIARMIGSVNTLCNRDGRLFGTNTDADGFHEALKAQTDPSGRTVAVFGAGGAGRAISFALFHYSAPAKVYLLDTDTDRREELKTRVVREFGGSPSFSPERIETLDAGDWGRIMNSVDIVVNASPAGMEPDVSSSVLAESQIPRGITVMDIVYKPHKTRLLENAEKRDCRTVYGIDMLLHQGIRQFELWTGKKAPVETMKKALSEALG